MRLIKSRLIYILLIACAIVYNAAIGKNNSELLVYGLILLPLLTLGYTLITLPFIRITSIKSTLYPAKGDEMTVTLRIKNKSFLPVPYLTLYITVDRTISENEEDEFTAPQISLTPFETREIELRIICRKHGYYNAGVTSYALIDYLRLIRLVYPRAKDKILIYPTVRPGGGKICESLASEYGVTETDSSFGNINPETREIREYRIGDPLNRIHRSLSSRGIGIFTREFEHEGSDSFTLIYDIPQIFKEDTDLIASIAATFLYDAMEKGFDIKLITAAGKDSAAYKVSNFRRDQFSQAYEYLSSRITEDGSFDFEMMKAEDRYEFPQSKLFIITTDPNQELLCFAARAADSGLSPVLISVKKPELYSGIYDELGIDGYFASEEENDPIWQLI